MELWPSCSTAFPLKPNTPEVSSCSQIKTKIYLGLQDPPWSNLFLPHLTHIAPLSSLWCFEWQVLFCHRTLAYALLSSGKTFPSCLHPTQPPHFTFQVTPILPSVSAQLSFPRVLFPSFCVLIPHSISPWQLLSELFLIWALFVPVFCTCRIFNKKAHIIWVLGSVFTISIFAVDSLPQIFSPHNSFATRQFCPKR